MTTPTEGIDHVLIAVGDLDRAATAWRRLGFTLSPRGVHSAAMGTANHTIMLGTDYFELLTVVAPTERNRRWRRALERGDGIAGVATVTPDAGVMRQRWLAAGFAPGDLIDFARAVERPGRPTVDARFQVVTLPDDTMPGLGLFGCAQLTRDAVWLPELQAHANGARAIRRLAMSAPDPADCALRWAAVLPGARVVDASVIAGAHRIDIARGQGNARGIGLDFVVADLTACAATLSANGVPHEVDGAGVRVAAADATGVAVTFVAP
jgi:catechol 2,3-dioxygenase-like lactoylglutathione lyase family enzyme